MSLAGALARGIILARRDSVARAGEQSTWARNNGASQPECRQFAAPAEPRGSQANAGPGLSHKNGPNSWLVADLGISGVRHQAGKRHHPGGRDTKKEDKDASKSLFPHQSKISETTSLILDAQRKRRERGYLPELSLFIKQSQKNRKTIQITTSKHYHRLSFKTDSTLVIFSTSQKTLNSWRRPEQL